MIKSSRYSREVNPQIDRIYDKLTETFRDASPTIEEVDRALESMELIAPLSETNVARKSYALFHVVMQAPVSLAYSQEKKWAASCLTVVGAYKRGKLSPQVKDMHSCITWVFEMSMDPDVIAAILRFIPEVVWRDGIRTTSLERLYDTVLECFSGPSAVVPELRKKAYVNALALLHLAIRCRCAGDESNPFKTILSQQSILVPTHSERDSIPEVVLGIIDIIFGDPEPTDQENLPFTFPHRAWMGHIHLYRAWNVLRKGEPLPDDVKEFVLHSLRLEPLPPATVVADCLFVVGLVIGFKLDIDDLLAVDRR